VKAKDQYGPVIAIVEKKRREAAAEGFPNRTAADGSSNKTEADSTTEATRSAPDTALAVFT